MGKVSFADAIHALHDRLTKTKYVFEYDTEDIVFGFRATKRLTTRKLGAALQIERKLRADLGQHISPSVRVVAVRMWRNDELRAELKA